MLPSSSATRKRNPYSIEELLKKPEKRRRAELTKDASLQKNLQIGANGVNEEISVNVEVCD